MRRPGSIILIYHVQIAAYPVNILKMWTDIQKYVSKAQEQIYNSADSSDNN